MKRILTAALLLLTGVFASAQQMPPMPVDPAVRIGHLENGLTYYVRHNAEPEGQANFYIAQKVGSILENDDQRGLAHFLEHMCFNGTEHFPGNGIVKYCESIGVKFGADLNAYTSIDETVYNIDNVPVATVPSAIDSCLYILHDWAGSLLLEDEDIDKERGVIHEEWRQRNDANSRMYEIILPKIYPGNKYGQRMPIGTMEVVDNFPYEALRSYYRTWYRPDQQAIVVVGDIDVDAVEAKIKDIFGTLPAAPADAPERVYTPVEDNEQTIVAIATDKEQSYPIIYVMAKHEAVTPAEKNTLDYLIYQYADAVADIMMSQRLHEMTEAADPDFVQAGISDDDFFFSKTKGAYFGFCTTDENQVLRGVTSIYREMLRATRNGFTASEYERARNELVSSIESQYNQREKIKSSSYCSEYVRHFIDNEPIPGIETEYALMQQLAPNIPVELVNEVVKSHMEEGRNLVVAMMLPQKEGLTYPSEEEVAAALAAVAAEQIAPYEDKVSDQPLIGKIRKPGKIKKVSEAPFGYTKMTLSNGATVYLKTTDFNKDEILLEAFSWGGTSLYPMSSTLKVVGAFHGLSRERSDARKYPAIDPLDSWSTYEGVIDKKEVDYAYSFVRRGSEVGQMMKVVGEEGTTLEDYIIYQKGEFVDSCYFQQNSFDPVDATVTIDRQKHVFSVLLDILSSDYQLKDKKDARNFFNQLRQRFLDWNGTPENKPEYEKGEKEIKAFFEARKR